MKKEIMHYLAMSIMVTGLFTFSCKKNEQYQGKKVLTPIRVNLYQSKLGKQILMLPYSSSTSAATPESLEKAIKLTIEDAAGILKTRKEISDIILDISFKNGKAIVTRTTYLNKKQRKIIEAYLLDEASGTYKQQNMPWYEEVLDGAACPAGFKQLAACSNMGNPTTCVSNAISTFLTSNINSIGDCATIQVQVGTLNTRVCGKTC